MTSRKAGKGLQREQACCGALCRLCGGLSPGVDLVMRAGGRVPLRCLACSAAPAPPDRRHAACTPERGGCCWLTVHGTVNGAGPAQPARTHALSSLCFSSHLSGLRRCDARHEAASERPREPALATRRPRALSTSVRARRAQKPRARAARSARDHEARWRA
ncbi:unnamed protein product [Boreogadus saida]